MDFRGLKQILGEKCGVLQECFSRRNYLSQKPGILIEILAIVTTAIIFMTLLMIIQYKTVQRIRLYVLSKSKKTDKMRNARLKPGVEREKKDVLDKKAQLNSKRIEKVDTFGEYLLATNVTVKEGGFYAVRHVYLGLAKGEALALAGLKRHGRVNLCEVLAGYKLPCEGSTLSMSRWKLETQPHEYSRHVSICCEREPLPTWMPVRDALYLIAVLRGVPREYVDQELRNIMEALELHTIADRRICEMHRCDRTRLHFAAAVVGAPPILVLDECTANQKFCVRRSIYHILYHLRKRGHAIFISSTNVESHMPVTNRLAIMVDGRIYDMDTIDNLVERYSNKGYTVVVHLKNEIIVNKVFAQYFRDFVINDTTEVLVNVQILDSDLNWAAIFEKMEQLQAEHEEIYSYIISAIPIDYIYNSILNREVGKPPAPRFFPFSYISRLMSDTPKKNPPKTALLRLRNFERKFDVTKLRELPWSVIFNR